MFTGLIQALGQVAAVTATGGDRQLRIVSEAFAFDATAVGDSIAVNGVCLTAVAVEPAAFTADVSAETLACTTAGTWVSGTALNLEPALRLGQALGGHWVSGHVDGVGEIVERVADARSLRFTVRMPPGLARYVAAKGSIAVDGVSLTVNAVDADTFGVNIVPHTASKTTFGGLAVGSSVNLEVDIIARYLERLLGAGDESPIDEDFLKRHGFA